MFLGRYNTLHSYASNSSDASVSDYSVFANNVLMQLKYHAPYMQAVFEDIRNQIKDKFYPSNNVIENPETINISEQTKRIGENQESIPLTAKSSELSDIAPEQIEEAKQVEEPKHLQEPVQTEKTKQAGDIPAITDNAVEEAVPNAMEESEQVPQQAEDSKQAENIPQTEESKQTGNSLPTTESTTEKAKMNTEIPNEIEQKMENTPSKQQGANQIQEPSTKKAKQLTL